MEAEGNKRKSKSTLSSHPMELETVTQEADPLLSVPMRIPIHASLVIIDRTLDMVAPSLSSSPPATRIRDMCEYHK